MAVSRNTPFGDLPQFLTPEEVQSWLKLGRSTTYELLRTGTLPVVRFGRLLRVPREALRQFIEVPTEEKTSVAGARRVQGR